MSLDNGIVLPGITRASLISMLEDHASGRKTVPDRRGAYQCPSNREGYTDERACRGVKRWISERVRMCSFIWHGFVRRPQSELACQGMR